MATTPQTQTAKAKITTDLLNSHKTAILELQASVKRTTAELEYEVLNGAIWESDGITVTGAVVGDIAVACPPIVSAGLVWCAYVSAADTVKVRIANHSGDTVTQGAQVWAVQVHKQTV